MPTYSALGIVVLIFKRNGNIRNCSCYGVASNLVRGMVVKMLLRKDVKE